LTRTWGDVPGAAIQAWKFADALALKETVTLFKEDERWVIE
jgi:hypothetical protein